MIVGIIALAAGGFLGLQEPARGGTGGIGPPVIILVSDGDASMDAAAYVARGTDRLGTSDVDGAIADFDAAIALERTAPGALRLRGTAWIIKRDYDRALADLDAAIGRDPTDSDAHRQRGNAWYMKRDVGRAMADYDKAVALDPRNAPAHLMRGIACMAQNEHDKALADFDRAIEIDPKLSHAYVQRGKLHHSAQRLDRAMDDYTQAIELDPRNSEARQNRSELWGLKAYRQATLGNDAGALKHLDLAVADLEIAASLEPPGGQAGQLLTNMKNVRRQVRDSLHKQPAE